MSPEPKEQSLRRQLIRAGSAGVMLRVLSVLAGLVSSVALARMLGPEQYGIYAFVLAILAILSIPMQVGLPTLVLRVTAQSTALSEWPTLRGIWSWAAGVVLAGSAVVIGLFLIWITFAAHTLAEAQRAALLIGLPLAPLLAAGQVRSAALRGFKRIWLGGLPDDVLRPVMLAILVLCAGVFFYNGAVTARTAMGLSVVAALLSFLLGTVFLWRSRPRALVETTARQFEHRRWLRSILPLSLIGGIQIIMQNTDLVMLGFLRSDAEVGQYRIAVSVATLAIFGLTVVRIVVQPYFAEAHARNDHTSFQRLASAGSTVGFAMTLMVVPFVWLVGEKVLDVLYGAAYVAAFGPLFILMIGQSVGAWFGTGSSALSMAGYERFVLNALIIAAILNCFGNVLLISAFGSYGAAAATSFSLALKALALWLIARHKLGIDCSPLGFFKNPKVKIGKTEVPK